MNDHIKSFLNEEQDPKAIEKITSKLSDLLMKNEEIGYIGVQKKPAINVFPDSIVLTNKRMVLCKPKNLGLSMDFTDYSWEDIVGTFVKEGILGSEFSFTTKTDITISIDYIPKAQARKIYTYAKEQLELLKELPIPSAIVENPAAQTVDQSAPVEELPLTVTPEIEEVEAEEVIDFAEIIPVSQSGYRNEKQYPGESPTPEQTEASSSEALFEKLQNYKKLLDNGLILQGEYDALKREILSKM